MRKRKVLILCPSRSSGGGVSNYYGLLKTYFVSQSISIDFYYTGSYGKKGRLIRIVKSSMDLIKLLKAFSNVSLVVLNPSLDVKSTLRDGVFHFIAKRVYRKQTVVFFRGWGSGFTRRIEKHFIKTFRIFFNFDKALVLAIEFKERLIKWGYDPESIICETTTFENMYADNKSFYECGSRFNILFLSRLVEKKGCLEAIKAVKILVSEFPCVKLFIAGDGEQREALKQYVDKMNLKSNVEFVGWLEGKAKYSLLNECGIMLFPTSYGEGMPNVLLEGMGNGLVPITRPISGIKDIVSDGENGFLVESLYPGDFAVKIKYLLENKAEWQTMSDKTRQVANENYEIKKVVKRIELIFEKMMK